MEAGIEVADAGDHLVLFGEGEEHSKVLLLSGVGGDEGDCADVHEFLVVGESVKHEAAPEREWVSSS